MNPERVAILKSVPLHELRNKLAVELSQRMANYMARPHDDMGAERQSLTRFLREAVNKAYESDASNNFRQGVLPHMAPMSSTRLRPPVERELYRMAVERAVQQEQSMPFSGVTCGLLGHIHEQHGILLPAAQPAAARGM